MGGVLLQTGDNTLTLEHRPGASKEARQGTWRKRIPGAATSTCNSPESGVSCLGHVPNLHLPGCRHEAQSEGTCLPSEMADQAVLPTETHSPT